MVVAPPRILIVGLGNLPYPLTRHSIGHLAIDSIASRLGLHFVADRKLGGFAAHQDVLIGESSVSLTLFKPKALMNVSGRPVANALRSLSVAPSSMIVLQDSLYQKPQVISPKLGGSANGHNGIRSIIAALGGDADFHRLRLGIGRNPIDAAAYVLGPLSEEEISFWRPDGRGTELAWKAIERIVNNVLKPAQAT